MKIKIALGVVVMLVTALTGCATSRNVTVGQLGEHKKLTTEALAHQDGNSLEMDSQIQQQLMSYGITQKPTLPAGTRQTTDADVIVTYADVWHWDLVMYLKSLTINLFDGQSGNLLVTGSWINSTAHGFHNYQDVIKELLDDMYAKLSAETSKNQASQQNDSQPSNTIATVQTTVPAVSENTVSATLSNSPISQRMQDLQALRKDNLITEEEFQMKRRQLLEKL